MAARPRVDLMDLQLAGKVALVTGSERGTGAVIADALAAEGVEVIRHAQTTTAESHCDIAADIATPEGSQQLLAALSDGYPAIDILINNYGSADRHSWRDTDQEKWLQMYEVNLLSAARLAQGLMEPMRASGWGRIINLGTIGSHQPNRVMPAYYAAKGALATLGASLALELSASGVTVNTVAPGLIKTAEIEEAFRRKAQKHGWGDRWEDIEKRVVAEDYPNPSGRLAERQEVADLVVFLSSPRAGYINGQNIRIDGGAVRYV